jgi:glycosyltransferase involved in cell wall biosynthesis
MEKVANMVSIITICYNCKLDFEKTVRSVIAQDYAAKEFIVVDGGSKDGTVEVISAYSKYIDKYVSEPDDGIYDALNKGVSMATGEWILCLNAGDVFRGDNVLSTIFLSDIPEDKSFIYSDFELVYDDGSSEIRKCDRKTGDVHHQNAIYRRILHERCGYYIVTHPYIVSDLLFFLSVPADQFLKTPQIISKVKFGGISCQLWASEGAWAAKAVYGIETIPGIFFSDMRLRFGLWRQKVKKRLLGCLKRS